MRVVYVDVLFFTNLAINYLLLLLTARFSGIYVRRLKILSGAALGALFAVLMYFPPMSFLASLASKVILCIAIVVVVFGKTGRHVLTKLCMVFTAVSFALAGGMAGLSMLSSGTGRISVSNGVPYLSVPLKVMLVSVIVVYCILGIAFGTGGMSVKRSTAEIQVKLGEKTLRLKALLDSGNMLREPISGKEVAVISPSAAAGLFEGEEREIIEGLTQENVIDSFERLGKISGGRYRLTPYRTASQSGGMIITVKAEDITINGESRDGYMIGISPLKSKRPTDAGLL